MYTRSWFITEYFVAIIPCNLLQDLPEMLHHKADTSDGNKIPHSEQQKQILASKTLRPVHHMASARNGDAGSRSQARVHTPTRPPGLEAPMKMLPRPFCIIPEPLFDSIHRFRLDATTHNVLVNQNLKHSEDQCRHESQHQQKHNSNAATLSQDQDSDSLLDKINTVNASYIRYYPYRRRDSLDYQEGYTAAFLQQYRDEDEMPAMPKGFLAWASDLNARGPKVVGDFECWMRTTQYDQYDMNDWL